MEHLIEGVRDAVSKESWYAATSLALALPDACGAIERPSTGSKARYTAWVERYVSKYFRSEEPVLQFLSAEELYRLRCSFLHQGAFDVEPDKSPTDMFSALNRVGLHVARGGVMPSRSMMTTEGTNRTAYNIAPADLCESICKGVEEWLPYARSDEAKVERMSKLPKIMHIDQVGGWSPL